MFFKIRNDNINNGRTPSIRFEKSKMITRGEQKMNLYHYFDKDLGPFKNLSELSEKEAEAVMRKLSREKQDAFCNKRNSTYMKMRKYYEQILRDEFQKKGGRMERFVPQYMVVEKCDFLESWYVNSDSIKIDIRDFDLNTLSFTYGDSHPTFSDRVNDGKEYRKKLYLYDEILEMIEKYGYPQEWNKDGKFGPERYIEVHVWSDETLKHYYR